jgi:hypothetical protein
MYEVLDVSQYTGSRARRGFEIVNFWHRDAANLRRVKLFYAANEGWGSEQLHLLNRFFESSDHRYLRVEKADPAAMRDCHPH